MSPSLRFLADESCDFAVVRALRAKGYDVLAVSEFMQRSDDRDLVDLAYREGRILLTEDKDFGWLVFSEARRSSGVILLRFPGNARSALAQSVLQLVTNLGESLKGAFVVIRPGQTRVVRLDKKF